MPPNMKYHYESSLNAASPFHSCHEPDDIFWLDVWRFIDKQFIKTSIKELLTRVNSHVDIMSEHCVNLYTQARYKISIYTLIQQCYLEFRRRDDHADQCQCSLAESLVKTIII